MLAGDALVISLGSALRNPRGARAMARSPTLWAATVVFSANEVECWFRDATRQCSKIACKQLGIMGLSRLADRRCSSAAVVAA